MQRNLTLRLDAEVIEQARRYAGQHGTSLSKLVAEYFALLVAGMDAEVDLDALPPITRSLVGILKGSDLTVEDYRRYLERRYGGGMGE